GRVERPGNDSANSRGSVKGSGGRGGARSSRGSVGSGTEHVRPYEEGGGDTRSHREQRIDCCRTTSGGCQGSDQFAKTGNSSRTSKCAGIEKPRILFENYCPLFRRCNGTHCPSRRSCGPWVQ